MEYVSVNAVIAIFGVFVGFFITNFFRSPKEYHGDIERRVTNLESLHSALALRFEGSHSRHDQALENLTAAVEKLTVRIERLSEKRNGFE